MQIWNPPLKGRGLVSLQQGVIDIFSVGLLSGDQISTASFLPLTNTHAAAAPFSMAQIGRSTF